MWLFLAKFKHFVHMIFMMPSYNKLKSSLLQDQAKIRVTQENWQVKHRVILAPVYSP